MNRFSRNIKLLYAIAALEGVVFYYALDKIFMQMRGLSLVEMVIVEIIFGLVIVLTEVPSGALSDRWSRKKMLALNSLFFALNTVIWAVSHSFILFVIGVIFGALHTTFRSGTDTSMLFDSLKELNKTDQYEKYLGRKRAIGAVSFAAAAVAGGLIGDMVGLEATFWWTLPSAVLAGVLALLLREPTFHRSTGEVSYWRHIGNTFTFLTKKPRLVHMVAVLTAITIPAILFDEYGQVYFVLAGVSIFGLGVLAALNSGIEALWSTAAYKLARLRHDVLFAICFAIMGSGFVLAGWLQNWSGIVLLFLGASTAFIVSIIVESDLNRLLPSSIRATSESFVSLTGKVFYVPVALGFAWVGQAYSIATAFAVLGCVVLAYLLLFAVWSAKAIGRGSKTIE